MKKIYLDTNIFSYLKDGRTEECLKLKRLLKELEGKIYCFYSIAHLHDLQKDKSGRIDEDLDFIGSVAHDNFLVREWKKPNVEYHLYYPKKALEIYKDDSDISELLDFKNLTLPEELDEGQRQFITFLQDQRLELGILDRSGYSKDIDEFLKLYFGEIKNVYTVGELLNQFASFYKSLIENDETFKGLRRSILEQLPLRQKWNIRMEDIDFDQKLENTPIAKSFMKFVKDSLYNKEDDPNYSYDLFTNAYYSLNVLGIDNEKNKRVKFSNILYDSFHSYYAAHCHYLVSNDHGLLTKSKVLYKFYGIDTKPVNISEFLEEFSLDLNAPKLDAKSFFEWILYQVKHGMVIREYSSLQKRRTCKEIRLKPWLLDYFNKMDIIQEQNGDTFIVLYKDFNYFHRIETWKDLESVTSRLIELLGTGRNFRSEFDEKDKNDINSRSWQGRIWEFADMITYLEINEGTNLLSFVLKP